MRIWPTKRFWKRLAIGAVVVVALALIGNGFMSWWVDHKLQTRIAAIRAAGDPASIADLAPEPIPADQNAAAYIERIAPRLEEFANEHGQFYNSTLGKAYNRAKDRGDPPSAEQLDAIRKIVDKYPDIERTLATAAICEKYASVADYSKGHNEFLDEILNRQVLKFRTVARFIRWRNELLIADGEFDQAAQQGVEILRLARLYDHEPTMVNMLVACAVRGMAVESLYDTLAAGAISPEQHAAIERELVRHDDQQRFVRSLKSERAFAIDSQIGLPSGVPRAQVWLFHVVGWPLKRYWVGALDYLDAEIDAVGRPWVEGRSIVGRREVPKEPTGYGVLADLLIPATQAAYDAEARITAMLRALRIFNALMQFRDEHGREARGLEELSLPREATIDPYSGAPLKLKLTDDGWVIYSVARNGVDDGGDFKDLNDYGVAPRKHSAN